MVERLPTGITVLDRRLDGGIPEGSTVLLVAPPASQAELFLYELTTTRGTLYLSTVRSGTAVEDAIAKVPGRVGNPTVRDIGGDAPLDNAHSLVRELPEGANLIVDVMDPLERRDPQRYRGFLNELQNHLVNTKGLAVLHAMRGTNVPDNRDLTKNMADVVFELHTDIQGSEIENRLAVPKFRGGAALEETIKLKLTEEVTIDTSRDIA
ncbi:MAG: RecA-superfamily ATPase [uncultured archaeon A07HB70]|nr:MAG: RecA-superfamily ATPase [uncultured archaeon A07HB70]